MLSTISRALARHAVSIRGPSSLVSSVAVAPRFVIPSGFRVVAVFNRGYAAKAATTKKATTTKSKTAATKATTTKKATAKSAAAKPAAKKKKAAASKKKVAAKKKVKAKKAAAKKPKKKKPLTPEQIEAQKKKAIRELKKAALLKLDFDLLPQLPQNVWFNENKELFKGKRGAEMMQISQQLREQWKAMSDAEKQSYEAKAKENRAANEAAIKKWILRHTPEEIYTARVARIELKRKGVSLKKTIPPLEDDRLPKQPGNAMTMWLRANPGILQGLTAADRFKTAFEKWRALTPEQRKPYEDQHAKEVEAFVKAMDAFRKRPSAASARLSESP